MDDINNKDEIVTENNLNNLNDELNNLNNLNEEDGELGIYEQQIFDQEFAQGGFSKIYKAIWLDGLIDKWDYEKQEWQREFEDLNEQDYEDAINPKIKNPLKNDEIHGQYVVLKSLNDSSKIDEDFLNEWKLHLQCQHEVRSNGSVLVPLNGITQDPDTLNYIIVMSKLPFELSLEICKGKRPEILEGTIPEYVEIMKRCWDNDPKKRPTAEELKWFFLERIENYPFEEDEEERIPVPENEPEIKYHPKSYYTSRKINYSTKINEILQSENLHHIVEEEAIQEFSDNELVL
ncbi:unnamed protein product [Rhizophagus irregularis]|nr:unnamed protein product [Rhizophagus irregularis]